MDQTMQLSTYGEMLKRAKVIFMDMGPIFSSTAMIDAATRATGVGAVDVHKLAEVIVLATYPHGEFELREDWAPQSRHSASILLAFVRELVRYDLAFDEEIRLLLERHKIRIDHKTGLLVPRSGAAE